MKCFGATRHRTSSFTDGSFEDRYRMKPSIARMALDLDCVDRNTDKTRQLPLARSNEALQHRLTELLLFEIRNDWETQFQNLSVRGLYKYVLRAIKVSADRRVTKGRPGYKDHSANTWKRRIDEGVNQHRKRASIRSQRTTDRVLDDGEIQDAAGLVEEDQKLSLQCSPTAEASKSNDISALDTRNRTGAKAVSLACPHSPAPVENSAKLSVESFLGEQESPNSPRSHVAGKDVDISCPRYHHGNGPVTYRERLGGYLHPRDMRRLVTPFSASNEPEIIVRRHVMLLNFDPLRAVVLRDRLLVLVPDGADSLLVDLEKRVRGGSQEIERDIFGHFQHEASQIDSSNIGDSQHSCQSDIDVKRISTASNFLRMTKKILRHDTRSSNTTVAATDATDATSNVHHDGETLETTCTDEATEFQEWDELDRRDWIDLPFELQCLDAVLGSVCAMLGKDSNEINSTSIRAMERLLNEGSGGEDVLRHMKNSIKEMTQRVKGFIRAINMILDESEDMALMNLSRLLTHPERFIQPVPEEILNEESDEPELILEAHLQQAFSLTNSLDLVRGEIQTTQELINQRLDAVRNRLLLANMVISVGSFVVAIGSFIGSIFGMNVMNFLEEDPDAFQQIVTGTLIGMLCMVLVVGFVLWCVGTRPGLRF